MPVQAPLIIDVAGAVLTAADRRRLRHPLVGGLILFTRNWENRRQLRDLCAEVKGLRGDLLIGVDHEGGRVQRFRGEGFTRIPAMRTLGRLWDRDRMRALDAATACGHVLGAELRACGVDLSFTPVLDLDRGRSQVIGDRALHRNPRAVTLLAKSLMHGLLQARLAHCAKHFPGHGHARLDSHTHSPRDRRMLSTILRADAAPYGWLGSTLQAVMPAHVVYPRVDERPAGFSTVWLQQVLRARLGFGGAIVSDDLSMTGARRLGRAILSPTEAVLAALQAGCDLALLCNQSLGDGAVIDEVLQGLEQARAQGRWRPDEAGERRRLALLPGMPGRAPQGEGEFRSEAYRRALRICRALEDAVFAPN